MPKSVHYPRHRNIRQVRLYTYGSSPVSYTHLSTGVSSPIKKIRIPSQPTEDYDLKADVYKRQSVVHATPMVGWPVYPLHQVT